MLFFVKVVEITRVTYIKSEARFLVIKFLKLCYIQTVRLIPIRLFKINVIFLVSNFQSQKVKQIHIT